MISSSEKLLVFKTPNGNKILSKFKYKEHTIKDALHTLRNVINFKLFAGSTTPLKCKLMHNKNPVQIDKLIDYYTEKDKQYTEFDIRHDDGEQQSFDDDIISKLKHSKDERENYKNLIKYPVRAKLRTWAKNNTNLGINGNTKSSIILEKMNYMYTECKQMFVKTLTGKTLTCDLKNNSLVSELMEQVYHKEGIPFDQQRIVYCGCQVEPNKKLIDYIGCDIHEVTVHLVLRLRGGMYDEKSGRNGEYKPISAISGILFSVEKDDNVASESKSISELIEIESIEKC